MRFFNTFRGRLLLILAFLLVATLGVQYYLNLRTQNENSELREAQEQALVAGMALGFTAMTSKDYRLLDLIAQPNQTIVDDSAKQRIRDIIIIDNEWQITDSLNPELLPVSGENDEITYKKLSDLTDLPPLMEGARLGDDLKFFPNRKTENPPKHNAETNATPVNTTATPIAENTGGSPARSKDVTTGNSSSTSAVNTNAVPKTENKGGTEAIPVDAKTGSTSDMTDEAHALPIDTRIGRWYVMVLLKSDKGESAWRAAQPLVFTLGVLLASSLITFFLVWRFARPIANLSAAAREVADGNLRVRVPDAGRNDEMGRLASRFNEMTAELEKKREIEVQLQQAEKSAVVGRLGSAIAHEIRNPLNYINLTLDHLRTKFAPDDPQRRETFEKLTSQLKDEVARIDQQISDFLHYSRPATVNPRPVSAREVVEDSLRIVEAQAAENGIKIGIIEHENVPQVLGDPEFLRSVFNNLFINAVQAMGSEGGNLNIRISPDDAMVKFEISDTGGGISEENLSKIFEPYFSTKETGTGLGLAIVQKIVESHSGIIEIESAEGKGTKFTVKLPRSDIA